MTADDERALAALQALAAHAPDEPWQPDTPAVLRRGRVLRARRRTGATAAGALVLALAVGVPAGLAHHTGPEPIGLPTTTSTATTTLPTTPATTPSPSATSTPTAPLGAVPPTTEVATDPYGLVFALNKPTPGPGGAVTANVADELRVTVSPTGSSGVTVAFDASPGHGTSSSVALTWQADDKPSDYSATHLYPAPTFSAPVPGTSMWYSYLVGMVPSWIQNPTVTLYSDNDWPLPDGTITQSSTVPTFLAPTADGRRMFVLVVIGPGSMASAFLSERQHTITFDGDPGGMYLPGCADQADPWSCVSLMWAQVGTQQRAQFINWPAEHPLPMTATSPTSEIAPGVFAATASALHADGNGSVPVADFDGAAAAILRDGADSDSRVFLTLDKGGQGPDPITKDFLGPSATVGYLLGWRDGQEPGRPGEVPSAVYGTTPAEMPVARVFLYAPAGFPGDASGGAVETPTVPTFTMPDMANNPIAADRQWFAVAFTGDAIDATRGPGGFPMAVHVIFAGTDGTIVDSTDRGRRPSRSVA